MKHNAVKEGAKVAVLMGGCSAEREVSLKSGNAILKALARSGVDAFGLDIKDDAVQLLSDSEFDVAFIALHGRGGEDGCIQGVLEWLGKPYTGSSVMASAIGMDKHKTKQIWSMGGLYTPGAELVNSRSVLERVCNCFNFPVMVKPIHEGSSIGIVKADTVEGLYDAYDKALSFDRLVMVEEFVDGDEFTVGIVSGEPLPVIGMQSSHDFYDYDAKYTSSDTIYKIPSGLSDSMERRLKELSVKAYDLIGCEGWARVDIMVDKSGMPWLIEINTCPGMTERSLVPQAAAHSGVDFDKLVLSILHTASLKVNQWS
jgi:D-alanine-D-alanine ligase